jgi:porin
MAAAGRSCILMASVRLLCAAAPALPTMSDVAVAQVATPAVDTSNARVPMAGLTFGGIAIRLGDTNFYQELAAGTGEHSAHFGGKLDALVSVDLGLLGAWRGLSLTAHGEYNYGQSANDAGGTLLPVNTALAFPGKDGQSGDLSSLFLTQRFGTIGSLSIGKINMLDQAANTPLRGGGGIDTFQNIGIAAPITGLVPPYIFGALGVIRTKAVILTVIAFDPESAVRAPPNQLFENGVNGLVAVTVPVSPFGLTGYQGVKIVGSNRRATDLRDVPQLILPQDTPPVLRGKRVPWFASYSFQQYLVRDKTDPRRGWGIFGEVGVSDGNPTPISRSGYVGVGGSSLFPGRALDRFGIGYFRYSLSDELRNVLGPLGKVKEETGFEAFYNAQVFTWLNVSGDLQVIGPALPGLGTAIFLGVRTRIGL